MKVSPRRRERRQRILAASPRLDARPVLRPVSQDATGYSSRDAAPGAAETATPAAIEICFAEAVRQHQAGHLPEAVALYRQALEQHSTPGGRGAILCNLGHALLALYRRQDALKACEEAAALLPDSVEALTNLGNVLLEMGRITEARKAYESALCRNPEWLPAIHNLGTVALEEGRFDLAREACDRALKLDPHFADARLNRGILSLLHADFQQGWEDYEARLSLKRTAIPRSATERPQWRGEPLHGETILLYAEQGLGDAIQFLRYVPEVVEAGGKVTLALPPRLMRLAHGLGARVIAQEEPLPECRWECPLMSLPLALGQLGRGWSIPDWKPYLTVPVKERTRVQDQGWSTDVLRVGLIWAGTPNHPRDWARSLSLELLEPLLTLSGVQFYSLQAGVAARQIEHHAGKIIDLAPVEHDMTDAAAKVLELDLLISADTSVAHLAGALGKTVWLLLPWIPDWRWQLNREDSPWYPSMRLFRQPARHAWQPVIARVRDKLVAVIESHWRDRPPAASDALSAWNAAHIHGDEDASVEERSTQESCEALPAAIVNAAPLRCKICAGNSLLFGVADFHKSCLEGQGRRLALSGVPVYYRRCEQCGFLSTEFFDTWTETAFVRHLYNVDYLEIDPDAAELRPTANARLVCEAFSAAREGITVLDYGGGSGYMAEQLRRFGFSAETYDPFSQHSQRPRKRFDLITAFEVLEHLPDPRESIAAIASLLKRREEDGEDGLFLFSTLLQPEDIQQTGMSWWYVAPRNGHCSLYTADALARLFASVGMQVASSSPALHLAYRRVPGFAGHLRIGAAQDRAASRC